MPRKVFVAGEVLTAADVNENLMDQAVMSFAGTAARGSAIGTAVEGMVTYLEDSDSLEIYAGTAIGWVHAASAGTPSYRYVDTVYFTSNDTFVKADYPWLRAIRVKVQAGGASGGSGPTTGSGEVAVGGGGGGGAYAESFISDLSTLSSSETVTVGAGGAAATGASGNNGGDSSFGTLVVAEGGFGGDALKANEGIIRNGGIGGRAANSTGDLKIGGSGASPGISINVDSTSGNVGGQGGASHLCGGSPGSRNNKGSSGEGFGGGGPGVGIRENSTAIASNPGKDGIVIVELFA